MGENHLNGLALLNTHLEINIKSEDILFLFVKKNVAFSYYFLLLARSIFLNLNFILIYLLDFKCILLSVYISYTL